MWLAKNKFHQPDYRFLLTLAALVIFGLIMLSSASAPEAYQRFGDAYHFVKRQLLFGLLPGTVLFLLFYLINYKFWKQISFYMLVASVILLLLVFIPGVGSSFGSARSWIVIGGFSFQPAELVKLTFLIYLASWLESRGKQKAADLEEGLIPFLSVICIISVLMMLQPDMGSLSIILFMSLAVYIIGGAHWKHIAGVVGVGIAGLLLMIKISPYRAARLTTFLHPELDPQGIGYHINQAFLAIGSGGIWGRGFGLSRQKFQYLPEVVGDSVFAIIAEELGFVFAVLLVLGFLYLVYRGFKIANAAPDDFAKLLVAGVVCWFAIQAFVNIGAMVGLMPLTGVPLPFISQGGTALAISLGAVGLVANISRQTKEY